MKFFSLYKPLSYKICGIPQHCPSLTESDHRIYPISVLIPKLQSAIPHHFLWQFGVWDAT